jgi:hypothetical protein
MALDLQRRSLEGWTLKIAGIRGVRLSRHLHRERRRHPRSSRQRTASTHVRALIYARASGYRSRLRTDVDRVPDAKWAAQAAIVMFFGKPEA